MNRATQISQTTFFTVTSWVAVVIIFSLSFMTTVSAGTFPFKENFKDQNLTSRGWQWIHEKRDDWQVREKNLEIKSTSDTTIYKGRDRGPSRNILVRPINANSVVDFSVTAEINTSAGGQSGLILYQDNDNYIKLVTEKLLPRPLEPFFVMLREKNGAVNHQHKQPVDIKNVNDIPGNDEIKVAIPGDKNRNTFVYDLRLRLQNKQVTMYWREPGQSNWIKIDESMPLPDNEGQWYAGIYSSGRSASDAPFRYRNFEFSPGKCSLDADGSGNVDALTDGLLLMRHMFGLRGNALVDNAVGNNCSRCDATDIEPFIAQCNTNFASDIDGNGEVDALTDGLLITRYLFGIRGAPLISGAVGGGCIRCSATEVEGYIKKGL
jgi:hypothetical protein